MSYLTRFTNMFKHQILLSNFLHSLINLFIFVISIAYGTYSACRWTIYLKFLWSIVFNIKMAALTYDCLTFTTLLVMKIMRELFANLAQQLTKIIMTERKISLVRPHLQAKESFHVLIQSVLVNFELFDFHRLISTANF